MGSQKKSATFVIFPWIIPSPNNSANSPQDLVELNPAFFGASENPETDKLNATTWGLGCSEDVQQQQYLAASFYIKLPGLAHNLASAFYDKKTPKRDLQS